MSGETEANVSSWTVDTLKYYMDAQLAALDTRAVLALAATDKAIAKAEAAIEKRFDGVNEFRETLADQAATLMPRVEYSALHAALEQKVDQLGGVIAEIRGLYLTRNEIEAGWTALRGRLDDLGARFNREEGNRSGVADRRKESISNLSLLISFLAAVLVAVSIVVGVIIDTRPR